MLINVPKNGPTTLIARDGKVYKASHAPDGRIVLDVPPAELFALLRGRDGFQWQRVNEEAIAQLVNFRFAV